MILPFVHRKDYEKQIDLTKMVLEENKRLAALLKLSLGRRKKRVEEPKPALTIPESPITPELSWAIEQRATGDVMLRRYLTTWTNQELAKGMKPEEIAQRIREGDGEDYE